MKRLQHPLLLLYITSLPAIDSFDLQERLCSLHQQPIVNITMNRTHGTVVLPTNTTPSQYEFIQNSPTTKIFSARACPCAWVDVPYQYYCILEDGNYCLENTQRHLIGCFHMNSWIMFIRNAWPLVMIWHVSLLVMVMWHYRKRLLSEATLRQDRDVVGSGGNSGGGGVTRQLVLKTKRFYYSEHVESLANRQQMDTDHTASSHAYQNENSHTKEGFTSSGNDCESSLSSEVDKKYAAYTDDPPQPSLVCTICLSEVRNGDRVGLLSCTHVFHSSCLKDWLRRKNACPLCQVPHVAASRTVNTDGDGDGNNNTTRTRHNGRSLSATEYTLEGGSRTGVRTPNLAPNDPPNEHEHEPSIPAQADADAESPAVDEEQGLHGTPSTQ